jgi:hypothetical protein
VKDIQISEVANGWTVDLRDEHDDNTMTYQRMVATTRDQALAIACAMMDGTPMPEAKPASRKSTF